MITCPACQARRRKGNTCRRCGRFDREALLSIQISPAATPTRRNNIPPRTPNNSFEKGIRKDERGVPYLDREGSPIHLGESFHKRHYERSVGDNNSGGNG